MLFGGFGRKRVSPVGLLFSGVGSAIGDAFSRGKDKVMEFGKQMINKQVPKLITNKLSEVADKTGITNVVGKDLLKTGLDFVGKNIGNVI